MPSPDLYRQLTVRQPWAHAIAHDGKDVENRTRNLAGEWRGTVFIHAGLLPAGLTRDQEAMLSECAHVEAYLGGEDLEGGAIVAVARLVDVHHVRTVWEQTYAEPAGQYKITCCTSKWAQPDGVYHHVLADVRPLVDPITWKGAQGLKRVTDLEVVGDHVGMLTEQCTCYGGNTVYGHEPQCGWESVSMLGPVL